MITDESLQPHRFVAQILQRGPENRNRCPLMRSSCFQLTFITPPGGVSRAKAWTTFTLTPFSFNGQRPKAMRSKAGANPEGCQTVAGGRTGQGGNDHRKTCFGTAHPGGVPDVALTRSTPAPMTGLSEISLAPQPGCRSTPAPLSGGRRPQDPRRPPATLCQPFGLTRPECPNSSGPTGRRKARFFLPPTPIGATPLPWGKSEILQFQKILCRISPASGFI